MPRPLYVFAAYRSLALLFGLSVAPLWAQEPGVWLTNGPAGTSAEISVLFADPARPAHVYAGTKGKGLFRSMDFGLTWQAGEAPLNVQQITTLVAVRDALYLGTKLNGLFTSLDAGKTWQRLAVPPEKSSIRALLVSADTLFAATEEQGVFRSSDLGKTWFHANAAPLAEKSVTLLAAAGNRIYAGTEEEGLFWSADAGASWEQAGAPLRDKRIISVLVENDSTLYAGTVLVSDPRFQYLYLSRDAGGNWEAAPALDNRYAFALLHHREQVYAGTNAGIFSSADQGRTWVPAAGPIQQKQIRFLLASDATLYAGSHDDGVYRSEDAGLTWLPANPPMRNKHVTALTAALGTLYAGTDSTGVLRSTDSGRNWFEAYKFDHANVRGVLPDLNVIFAYGDEGVFRSQDGGFNWTQVLRLPPDQTAVTMLSSNGILYAGTGNATGSPASGLFYSNDGGTVWTQAQAPMDDKHISSLLAIREDLILAGTATAEDKAHGIYFSRDRGKTWQQAGSPMSDKHVTVMVAAHNRIYAGTGVPRSFIRQPNGIFFSTDNGLIWREALPPMHDKHVTALLAVEDKLHAGIGAGYPQVDRTQLGVFSSSDHGLNWQSSDSLIADKEVSILAFAQGRLFAGTTSAGLFYSDDEGRAWKHAEPPLHNKNLTALLATEAALYAGTDKDGVFRSLNGGATWTSLDFGMGKRAVTALAYLPQLQRLFAATEDGVYLQTVDTVSPVAVSLEINDGARYTSQRNLALIFVAAGADSMIFAEDSAFVSSRTGWLPHDVLASFVLLEGDGLKTIYAKCKDRSWNESETLRAQIILDTHAPVFQSQPPAEGAHIGQNFFLPQQVEEPNLDKVLLYYRRGNEPWREEQAIRFRDVAVIDGTLLTPRGFDYRLVAFDLAGNVDTLRNGALDFFSLPIRLGINEAGNSPDLPSGTTPAAYRLVSLPMKIAEANVAAVFGDLGEYGRLGDWRFWSYQGHGQWQEGPELLAQNGAAYFLIRRNGGTLTNHIAGETTKTTAGISGEIPGWHLRANDWTLIGNPYNFPIALEQLQLVRLGLRLSEADTNFQVWAYDQRGWMKDKPLEAWRGLAVYRAGEEDTLIFTNDARSLSITESASRKPSLETGSASEKSPFEGGFREVLGEWLISVRAESQGSMDEVNYLGVREGAKIERDVYDWYEPPFLPSGLSLSFPHPEWHHTANFATDIRPLTKQGYEWRLAVKAVSGSIVSLTFEGIATVPSEFEVWLVDEALQITQNLREQRQYAVAGAEHPKALKLVVGKREFITQQLAEINLIPATYELSQNFPNPFNPVTTIRYGLPQAERVSLKIYNLLGEEVATLVNDEHKAPGYHVAIWDGRGKNGNVAASGVYVYRMQAGSFALAKKLALIK